MIQGATIENNGTVGISIRKNTVNSLFQKNNILNNGGYGIHLNDGATKNIVRKNILTGNTDLAIQEDVPGDNLIVDNLDYNNGP